MLCQKWHYKRCCSSWSRWDNAIALFAQRPHFLAFDHNFCPKWPHLFISLLLTISLAQSGPICNIQPHLHISFQLCVSLKIITLNTQFQLWECICISSLNVLCPSIEALWLCIFLFCVISLSFNQPLLEDCFALWLKHLALWPLQTGLIKTSANYAFWPAHSASVFSYVFSKSYILCIFLGAGIVYLVFVYFHVIMHCVISSANYERCACVFLPLSAPLSALQPRRLAALSIKP